MRKLLLQADVPALGRIGDVVKVSDGYARNYLLPQRLAVEPTPKNIARVEEERKQVEAQRALELAQKKALVERLGGVEITIVSPCNEQGVLFGSVGPKEIADALHQEGYNVDPKHVKLADHFKQVDKYSVPLELAPEAACTITVWVAPTKESAEAMAAYKEAHESETVTETDDTDTTGEP